MQRVNECVLFQKLLESVASLSRKVPYQTMVDLSDVVCDNFRPREARPFAFRIQVLESQFAKYGLLDLFEQITLN